MSKRVLKLKINRGLFEEEYKKVKDFLRKNEKLNRIYIDTNIFGRALDGRISSEQASALARIIKRNDIDLYTSEKTREEIKRHPKKEAQSYLDFISSLVDIIPEENFVKIEGGPLGTLPLGVGVIGGGMEIVDSIFESIRNIFDQDDSEHIYQAIKSNAKYFLTNDKKTILSRRKEFNELGFNLKLVSPKNLENILFSLEDNVE